MRAQRFARPDAAIDDGVQDVLVLVPELVRDVLDLPQRAAHDPLQITPVDRGTVLQCGVAGGVINMA